MGRAPCCDKASVKKGPWSPEEDAQLKEYIEKHGTGGNWIALPPKAGLRRCGKSCRLRWLNYLRPNIKHGEFSQDEDRIICSLFANIGSRWSIIAAQLPGRTDNDIKNYWNTKLKKKLIGMAPFPSFQKRTHRATNYPSVSLFQTSKSSSAYSSPSPALPSTSSAYNCSNYNDLNTPARSLTGYEIMSIPSSLSISTSASNSTVLQAQDGFVKDSLLVFGAEASCSSSDGSCNNLISQSKELECHEFRVSNGELMGLQSSLYSGIDQNQKFLSNVVGVNGFTDEKPNGVYGETPLDYSLEEIKQLISTNICNNLNFFVDENKEEEKFLYY
ncbi:unnamed protein product [Ilex paraguariensis]|uniref:Transcription factor RAX2 n=1 Tax=Ilex paraguariensis TaxID=185542 RepID=A0ABC8U739_9AQUA